MYVLPMKNLPNFINIYQIYKRTTMSKCGFNKVARQLYWNHTSAGCSPVNLLHIFKTLFPKNTSGGLLLWIAYLNTFKGTLVQSWKFINISVTYENNMLKISHKTRFTFWDMRTWDMWKVCLQTFRNNRIC